MTHNADDDEWWVMQFDAIYTSFCNEDADNWLLKKISRDIVM